MDVPADSVAFMLLPGDDKLVVYADGVSCTITKHLMKGDDASRVYQYYRDWLVRIRRTVEATPTCYALSIIRNTHRMLLESHGVTAGEDDTVAPSNPDFILGQLEGLVDDILVFATLGDVLGPRQPGTDHWRLPMDFYRTRPRDRNLGILNDAYATGTYGDHVTPRRAN